MKLYVWFKQHGEGCDYSIGCGESLEPLKATTLEEAKIEVFGSSVQDPDNRSDNLYEYKFGSHRSMQTALILQLVEDVTAGSRVIEERIEAERLGIQRKYEEEQFEALRKKLGK